MGAVQDRLDVTLDELKNYLGIPVDEDDDDLILGLMLDAAKEAADAFLNNPFEELDGDGEVVERPIPSMVKAGVIQWAAFNAVHRDPTITSRRASALAESYASKAEGDMNVRRTFWAPFRLMPGL